jgi:hypothetical protein
MSILAGEPEVKRPLLTPRLGREGNIKEEGRELEMRVVDGSDSSDGSSSVINPVMNVRFQ